MAETMVQWARAVWQFTPTHPLRAWRCWLLRWTAAVMFGFGLLCLSIGWALAQSPNHEDGHAQYHDVYREWKQPGIFPPVSCCNERKVYGNTIAGDCYPTQFRLTAKGWQAKLSAEDQLRIGDEWVDVPDRKIIRKLNPDETGRAGHLCVSLSTGEILCAVPPTGAM